MNKNKIIILVFLLLTSISIFPADLKVNKIEPPNWWTGMKLNKIQLMIYGENLNEADIKFSSADIKILKIHNVQNNSFSFIDIEIPSSAKPGNYKISFDKNNKVVEYDFPVLARKNNPDEFKGFNSSDVVYLITPDRFANGDVSNDKIEGLVDSLNRKHPSRRHGGDLQGIINQLNYLSELGVTALWINPVLENNMPVSYHGYAATDLYKVDPRLGTNELYKKLVDLAHEKGIKIIYDHVANHIGINHGWMKNLPMDNWLNGSIENHTKSNHEKISISDPHAAEQVLTLNTDGWFTDYMPDLNQKNPFVANYLIQNMIWWIEYSGLDGIREDTYPYADQKFLSEWNKIILKEYPEFNIVGESWVIDPLNISYYQRNNFFPQEFNSNLPSVMDFSFSFTSFQYLKGEKKLHSFYEHFTKDFVYSDPDNLFTFLDNHDWERAIFSAKGNTDKFKIALSILFTTRGIPQILYATEIGMMGNKDHGTIRSDFPGGFVGDERNAFTEAGRTESENNLFEYVKELIHLRKNFKSLSSGKMIHYPPKDEIYYYFKTSSDEKILIIINGNDIEKEANLEEAADILKDIKKIIDVQNKDAFQYSPGTKIKLKPMSTIIYRLL